MRYLLLIYGCDRPDEPGASSAKRAAVQEYYAHLRERGVLLGADPLCGVDTASTVRVRDGETLITDGPFAETVEQLGGYFLLDCRDRAEAEELAARCPMAAEGSVEVRPVLTLPDPDPDPDPEPDPEPEPEPASVPGRTGTDASP